MLPLPFTLNRRPKIEKKGIKIDTAIENNKAGPTPCQARNINFNLYQLELCTYVGRRNCACFIVVLYW